MLLRHYIGIPRELEPIRHFGLRVQRHLLEHGITKDLVTGAIQNIAHVFLVQPGIDIFADPGNN